MPTLNTRQLYVALGLATFAAMAKVAVSKRKKKTYKNNKFMGLDESQALTTEEAEKAIKLLQPSFDQAASIARTKLSDKNLSTHDQLMLYGLYKQASLGDASDDTNSSTSAPSKLNMVATKKYQAWCKFHGMPRHFAMMKYIEVVEHFTETGATSSSSSSSGGGSGVGSSAMLDLAMDGDDIVYEDEDDEVNFSDDDDVSFASATDMNASSRTITPSLRNVNNMAHHREISMAVRQSTMATHDELDDEYGESSPVFQAAGSGDDKSLRDLITNHADTTNVDDRDEDGQCPLHLAADHGHLECVKILLDADADPNATDKEGISVLEAAVMGGKIDVVRLLLDAGADPDHKDFDGDSPRTCAEIDDNEEMQRLLRDAPPI